MNFRWTATDQQIANELGKRGGPLMLELMSRGERVAIRARARVKVSTGHLHDAIAAQYAVDPKGLHVKVGVIDVITTTKDRNPPGKYATVQEFDPVRGRPYLRPSLSAAGGNAWPMSLRIRGARMKRTPTERGVQASKRIARALRYATGAKAPRRRRR